MLSTIAAILPSPDAQLDASHDRTDVRALLHRLVSRGPTTAPTTLHVTLEDGVGLAARGMRPADVPIATDGRVRVAFDGRLDDRGSVVARLRDRGIAVERDAPDAALIAAAYRCWKLDCVDYLLGDFAWIVWDGDSRQLVAARDRFGVKPLYYATVAGRLVVANDLGQLRRCPGASSDLSDAGVADVLRCGMLRRPDITCFAGINRVPPAHRLHAVPAGGPRLQRYWQLDTPAEVRYRDARQYGEHFRETLQMAVRERLAGESAASVLMSGGLDSTSVAALAADALGADRCVAVTAVYDRLMRDEERRYSTEASRFLRVAIRHVVADDYELFGRWSTDAHPPEPIVEPLTALSYDLLSHGRSTVMLTGYGGDPSLLPGAVVRQLGRQRFARLAADLTCAWRKGLWPPLGLKSGLLARARRDTPPQPAWLSPAIRVAMASDAPGGASRSHWREAPRVEARRALADPAWWNLFEGYDPVATRRAVDVRHPFFDLRVVRLALALPSYPWCLDKTVLRDGMTGRLPPSVVRRPKTPLAADAVAARQWTSERMLRAVTSTDAVARYVDADALRTALAADAGEAARAGGMACVSLALWLRGEHGGASGGPA